MGKSVNSRGVTYYGGGEKEEVGSAPSSALLDVPEMEGHKGLNRCLLPQKEKKKNLSEVGPTSIAEGGEAWGYWSGRQ